MTATQSYRVSMSLTLLVNVDLLFCRISFSMGFLRVTLELCIIAKNAEGHFSLLFTLSLVQTLSVASGSSFPQEGWSRCPAVRRARDDTDQSGGWRAHVEWGGVLMGSQGRTTGPCSSLTPGFNLTVFSDHPDPEVPFL